MKTEPNQKELTAEERWRETHYYDIMRDRALIDGATKPNDWLKSKTRCRKKMFTKRKVML